MEKPKLTLPTLMRSMDGPYDSRISVYVDDQDDIKISLHNEVAELVDKEHAALIGQFLLTISKL